MFLVWEEKVLSFPGWAPATKEFTLFNGPTKALSVHPRVSLSLFARQCYNDLRNFSQTVSILERDAFQASERLRSDGS